MYIEEALHEIVGLTLASVEFVHDYIQLRFNGPQLTLYTLPTIKDRKGTFRAGQDTYCDVLVRQIGKKVKGSNVKKEEIELLLETETQICISLRERDYRGPEALEFRSANEQIWVV